MLHAQFKVVFGAVPVGLGSVDVALGGHETDAIVRACNSSGGNGDGGKSETTGDAAGRQEAGRLLRGSSDGALMSSVHPSLLNESSYQ